MTYIKEATNDYGTPVSAFVCNTCGNPFTVCPAVTEVQHDEWQNCMSEDCDSYKPTRDADLYFGTGMVERDTPSGRI